MSHKVSKSLIFLFMMIAFFESKSFAQDCYTLPLSAGYGVVSTPLSSPSCRANQYFLKGLAMMYNYEFHIARYEFIKAQEIDPNFALAYWGEAMTWHNPHEKSLNIDKAREALKKISNIQLKPSTSDSAIIENKLIEALQSYIYASSDHKGRKLYLEHMKKISLQFPDNMEIQALYSSALLAVRKSVLDFKMNDQVFAIGNKITKKNPAHPGAIHNILHAYENPFQAKRASSAAKNYPIIAPKSQHALHMPSHYYYPLGMWDEIIKTNIKSWSKSVEMSHQLHKHSAHVKNHGKSHAIHHKYHDSSHSMHHEYHGLSWLIFAYIQKEDYKKSQYYINIMRENMTDNSPGFIRWYYARSRALYLLATGKEPSKFAYGNIKTSDLETSAAVADLYANAILLLDKNKIKMAQKVLNKIQLIIKKNKPNVIALRDKNPIKRTFDEQGFDAGIIMADNLHAKILFDQNRKKKAIALMKKNIDKENRLEFLPGPPIVIRPSSEILGYMYLDMGQAHKAQFYFTKSLILHVNRTRSLRGLARADNIIEKQKKS